MDVVGDGGYMQFYQERDSWKVDKPLIMGLVERGGWAVLTVARDVRGVDGMMVLRRRLCRQHGRHRLVQLPLQVSEPDG